MGAPSGKSDYQGLRGLLPNECTDAVCDPLCLKPLRSKACPGNYSRAATAIGSAVNGRERPVAAVRALAADTCFAAFAVIGHWLLSGSSTSKFCRLVEGHFWRRISFDDLANLARARYRGEPSVSLFVRQILPKKALICHYFRLRFLSEHSIKLRRVGG